MHDAIGEPINWEFSSADARTAAAIRIRDAGGVFRTLAATERVTITSLSQQATAGAQPIFLFDDANDDGNVGADELLAVWANGMAAFAPIIAVATLGKTPKVKATGAGQIYVCGSGYITKG